MLHLHNQSILTADFYGSFANTLTFSNGLWASDYPSLVLGSAGPTNQGIIQIYRNATQSVLFECSTSGNFEIYQKIILLLLQYYQ